MLHLTPHECRILGVLVEKAQTTPAQYPLTLNALASGSNQKSNRHPVLNLSEDDVLTALDGLRGKDLVREVMLSGSRVEKYRHVAREKLDVSTNELIVLTEMLLRGPQTVGELRGRASRMHPLESIEVVHEVLQHLQERSEPLVRTVAPESGSRATRYAQLLCPDLHPFDAAPATATATAAATPVVGGPAGGSDLAERLARLEREVAALRAIVETIADPRITYGAD